MREDTMTRWMTAAVVALTLVFTKSVLAQDLGELRKQYDAGQYQQVIGAPADDPRVAFLIAQSHQKLGHRDEARAAYEQLAARGAEDPWHDVGKAALAVMGANPGEAVDAANQAVGHGDSVPEAHFQRGLALSAKQDMAAAAAAFERAVELDPGWADAHYYAGLAYSKIKRVDLMAGHFDTFLRLAPQSPQRPEVQSIMRTLGK
jgi:tetratricopeptide (TPR) repeat protein